MDPRFNRPGFLFGRTAAHRFGISPLLLLGSISLFLTPLHPAYPNQESKAHPIRLQLKWRHQFQFAGYYAAHTQGYYREAGLDVTILEGNPANSALPTVLQGNAEFGVSDTDVLLSRLKGNPIVTCAAIFQHSPYIILTRADRGIRTPTQLVGARIMFDHDQGAAQFRAMLINEGLDPAKVRIIPHSWNIRDLADRKVDGISAYSTVEPHQLKKLGIEPYILKAQDYGVDFYGDVLFTTEKLIADHPDRTAAFVHASLRGWDYALKNPEVVADHILTLPGVAERGLTREMLLDEAEAMRELILPEIVHIGHMNLGRWQHIAEIYAEQQMVPADFNLDGFLYNPNEELDSNLIRNVLLLTAGLVAATFTILIWNMQIRRSVRSRTTELRREIVRREAVEQEQRELTRRLEIERGRLAEAQSLAKIGHWEHDLATGSLFWSEQTHRIFETDPDQFIPTFAAFLDHVHPDDRALFQEHNTLELRLQDRKTVEHRVLLPDGRIKYVEERWKVFLSEHGTPLRTAGTCQDITERKNLEKQFLRAQRMESIGTLAGGIAHDLNNLLVPVLMGADMLRMDHPKPEHREIILNIERSAKRAADLVKQVLSFARGIEGSRVTVDLPHIVHDIELIVANTFPKNIGFSKKMDPSLWPVLGDPTQINQVLLNLCVNARDAMPTGGHLAISVRNQEVDPQFAAMHLGLTAGYHVVIEVADTGSGIDKALLERIFEPFFSTKPVGSGTGLGLSTAMGIVRSHGGSIQVDTEHGKGTTFRIYLPAKPDSTPPVPPPGSNGNTPRGRGHLILLVDDEPSILQITRQTLESFGYRTLTAGDGAQAVGLFATHRHEIDLILTDMMMPIMDGPAFISAVRHIDAHIGIIATSGVQNNGPVSKDANAGYTHMLPKPYSAENLLQLIHTALAGKNPRSPVAPPP